MSQFDPQAFLDATIDQPLEKRPPLPAGDYMAVIGEVTARAWTSSKDPSKSGICWDIPLAVDVPAEIQASLGLNPTLTLKDSIFLDITPQGGLDIAPGRNGGLRRYREATKTNNPGESFSARKLVGRVVRVKISHEDYQGAPVERVSGVVEA